MAGDEPESEPHRVGCPGSLQRISSAPHSGRLQLTGSLNLPVANVKVRITFHAIDRPIVEWPIAMGLRQFDGDAVLAFGVRILELVALYEHNHSSILLRCGSQFPAPRAWRIIEDF